MKTTNQVQWVDLNNVTHIVTATPDLPDNLVISPDKSIKNIVTGTPPTTPDAKTLYIDTSDSGGGGGGGGGGGLTPEEVQAMIDAAIANVPKTDVQRFFYDGSNTFDLGQKPKEIISVDVTNTNDIGRHYELEQSPISDYTLSGTNISIQNPSLIAGDKIKVVFNY